MRLMMKTAIFAVLLVYSITLMVSCDDQPLSVGKAYGAGGGGKALVNNNSNGNQNKSTGAGQNAASSGGNESPGAAATEENPSDATPGAEPKAGESGFDPAGSAASREKLGENYNRNLDRLEGKDFTAQEPSVDTAVVRDHFLYLFYIINDLNQLNNYIRLDKEKMKAQRFFDVLQGLIGIANRAGNDYMALTAELFNKELGKITATRIELGQTSGGNLFEIEVPITQEVQIERDGTLLQAEKTFGFVKNVVAEGIFECFGLSLKTKDFTGKIKSVTFDGMGSSSFQLVDAQGTEYTHKMLGENFIYFFVWLFYKFDTQNETVTPWLSKALEKNPVTPTNVAVTETQVPVTNEAQQVKQSLVFLEFLLENNSVINIDHAFLRDSSFGDYQLFYKHVLVQFVTDMGLDHLLPDWQSLEAFPEGHANAHEGKRSIKLNMTKDVGIVQTLPDRVLKIKISKDQTYLRYSDSANLFYVVGMTGGTSEGGIVPVNVTFSKFTIGESDNTLNMDYEATGCATFFCSQQKDKFPFDLAKEVEVVKE